MFHTFKGNRYWLEKSGIFSKLGLNVLVFRTVERYTSFGLCYRKVIQI